MDALNLGDQTLMFMKQSTKQQWIVLSATVVTLVLGAGIASFHKTQIWPLAVLLGAIWGTIRIWIIWRHRRRGDSDAKK